MSRILWAIAWSLYGSWLLRLVCLEQKRKRDEENDLW